ncbi:hypothetical protein PFISCL1PPCAC_5582, partial [Pristionchus fissidentatus]
LLFLFFVTVHSANRKEAEEELRYLSDNARSYLTQLLISSVAISILIFAFVLCICDVAIRILFDLCRRGRKSEIDIERGSNRTLNTVDTVDSRVDTPYFSISSPIYGNIIKPSPSVLV